MTGDGERGRELFDPAPVFAADDYLHFYGFDEMRDAADAEDALRALDAPAGAALLDLACGHGRITNLLAEQGYRMTGLDRDAHFLELAREDAARRGVAVDYVKGDMRALPWTEAFDGILCWFTAFGYFDETGNRRVIAEALRALRPGGRLALETLHRDNLMGRLLPSTVVERDGDLMLDLHRFDVEAGVMHTDRRIVRDGRVRRAPFAVRLLAYTELAEWLREAGFASVLGTGGDGSPLTLGSRRMIVVATR
jgi:SAM-dependent methyltransferase